MHKHVISPIGRRPAGIGNEIIALAKGLIAKKVFPGVILRPKYEKSIHSYPQVILDSYPIYKNRLKLSKHIIDVNEFRKFANYENLWDYTEIVQKSIRATGRNFEHILHDSKMFGGYLAIRSAKNELQNILFRDEFTPGGKFRVAMHIRGSDAYNSVRALKKAFQLPSGTIEGQFNRRISDDFYTSALNAIFHSGLRNVHLLISTNETSETPLLNSLQTTASEFGYEWDYAPDNPIEALRLISEADLIVPSISSFSLLAIFLSNAKYLWPRKHLTTRHGTLSIWGFEKDQIDGPTEWLRESALNPNYNHLMNRGIPFPSTDFDYLKEWMHSKLIYPISQDLIYYGSVQDL